MELEHIHSPHVKRQDSCLDLIGHNRTVEGGLDAKWVQVGIVQVGKVQVEKEGGLASMQAGKLRSKHTDSQYVVCSTLSLYHSPTRGSLPLSCRCCSSLGTADAFPLVEREEEEEEEEEKDSAAMR